MNLLFKKEFYEIKNACLEIRKQLGNGFLEKVYENALKYELELRKFKVESQKEILVYYKNCIVGKYYADLVVNDQIIIELKCVHEIKPIHKSQLLNYLKATGYNLGLIVNFPNEKKGVQVIRVPNFMNMND